MPYQLSDHLRETALAAARAMFPHDVLSTWHGRDPGGSALEEPIERVAAGAGSA